MKNKVIQYGLTVAFCITLGSIGVHADFSDNFESGNLDNWTIGGRQLGTHTANVVPADNGSLAGHLYQSGQFTEITFEQVFRFESDVWFSFDLKVNAGSTTPPASNFYGMSGVQIQFLGSGNSLLGSVYYVAATTDFPFSVLANTTTALNQIPTNSWMSIAACPNSLLSQIAIDQSLVENVRLRFQVYSSTWPNPTVTVELWADNVDVVYGDADSDGLRNCQDNCIFKSNVSQRDTNGDSYGNICDPDLNNDGVVNTIDLGMLRLAFFTADPDADFNGDGVVNVVDLGIMKSHYFMSPGPSGTAP